MHKAWTFTCLNVDYLLQPTLLLLLRHRRGVLLLLPGPALPLGPRRGRGDGGRAEGRAALAGALLHVLPAELDLVQARLALAAVLA